MCETASTPKTYDNNNNVQQPRKPKTIQKKHKGIYKKLWDNQKPIKTKSKKVYMGW